MSQKDRDRLKVLHEVEKGHLTQKQGTPQGGVISPLLANLYLVVPR